MSRTYKETVLDLERRGGGNFGQSGPSPAKVAAAIRRDRERDHVRYACDACPYTRTAVCAWECAYALAEARAFVAQAHADAHNACPHDTHARIARVTRESP